MERTKIDPDTRLDMALTHRPGKLSPGTATYYWLRSDGEEIDATRDEINAAIREDNPRPQSIAGR